MPGDRWEYLTVSSLATREGGVRVTEMAGPVPAAWVGLPMETMTLGGLGRGAPKLWSSRTWPTHLEVWNELGSHGWEVVDTNVTEFGERVGLFKRRQT